MKVFYPSHTRDELVARLRADVAQLAHELPVRRAVLFGSWAQDRATAFSDVDLLVVYGDPPRADAFHCVRNAVDVRGLEPHVYSETDAAAVWPTIERMIAGGVDLLAGAPTIRESG